MDQGGIARYIVPANSQQFYSAPEGDTVYVALPAPRRRKRTSAFVTALLVVLLVVLIAWLFQRHRRAKLASRLARDGWVLYTRPGCGYCTKQAAVLGVKKYAREISCQLGSKGLCDKIKGFPHWYNMRTHASRTGLQTRRELEDMLKKPAPREHLQSAAGEFWWQKAGQAPPQDDGRYTTDLAELVGASGGGGWVQPMRKEASFVLPKETLRSRGNYRAVAAEDQCASGIGCGLGSTWIDSRFEPGPNEMYLGCDYPLSPGSDAGGPTFTGFTPSVFQSSGAWNRYVHGFGDGDLIAPVAPCDEQS